MNEKTANMAVEFAHITARNKNGRATEVIVPAHNGRFAKVTLDRQKGRKVYTTCTLYQVLSDADEGERCPGCQTSICYHVLAAFMHTLNDNNKQGRFYSKGELATAQKYAIEWGGKLITLVSGEGGSAILVVEDLPQKKPVKKDTKPVNKSTKKPTKGRR